MGGEVVAWFENRKGPFAVSWPSSIMNTSNNLVVMFFDVCWPELLIFNRLRTILPKRYQGGRLGKSYHNGDNLNQAMRKTFFHRIWTRSVWVTGPLLYRLS